MAIFLQISPDCKIEIFNYYITFPRRGAMQELRISGDFLIWIIQ